jgi:hypothetical protein
VSLRSAIEEGNSTADNVVIQMGVTGTITLESALPFLRNDFYINNPTGSSGLTVKRDSAASPFRLFTVGQGQHCVIGGLTLRNGLLNVGPGGAIYDLGDLTVSGCTITANGAETGGAIATAWFAFPPPVPPQLTLIGDTITNNLATDSGGAIYLAPGTSCDMSHNCVISGNAASGLGGAIYVAHGDILSVSGSTITNNTAQSYGGGIYGAGAGRLGGALIGIQDSTISSNRVQDTSGKGGGIYIGGGSLSLTNTTVQDNQATTGSGIYYIDGTLYSRDGGQIINNTVDHGPS